MSVIIPVILCGGSGTRLWPLSRRDRPKQFITLIGNHTLLEGTLLRAAKISGAGDPICVTAAAQGAAVRQSLDRVQMRGTLVLEPSARNTAPALCAAALVALKTDAEAIVVALPADHVIEDDAAFATSMSWACAAALGSQIVVLGVEPRHAADGFGYIVPGASLGGLPHVARVEKFIEKPDEETARGLIERGALWNAGIVVARASAVVEAIGRHAPEVLAAVKKSLDADGSGTDAVRLTAGAFAAAPSVPFDRAVLEKSSDVVVVRLPAMWRDVGTWDAVAELFSANSEGNRLGGRVRLSASTDNFVFSPHRLTVGLGLRDLVVVDTPDALLIANRLELADLREVVAAMAADHYPEVGSDDLRASSGAGDAAVGGIEMRQTSLKPGESRHCDPQLDASRYWIVLEGAVRVTIGGATSRYGTHQSFHAAPGQACGFANDGGIPARLLELRLKDKPTL